MKKSLPQLPKTSLIHAALRGFRTRLPGAPIGLCALLALAAAANAKADTKTLPDGPGKQVTVRVCGKCHAPELAVSLHQSRRAWEDTISKMVGMGATASDDEFEAVVDYLAKNFPPEAPKPININTATSVDLESSLVLLRSEAAAIIAYRTKHGPFKTLEDLRKVPGLDFNKLEAEQDRITF